MAVSDGVEHATMATGPDGVGARRFLRLLAEIVCGIPPGYCTSAS